MREVLLVVGAIDRHVAGMHDEVGVLRDDPVAQRRPVRAEMPLGRAEVGVGNLQDACHESGLSRFGKRREMQTGTPSIPCSRTK